ncbi:c-type cytochrome, partial [Vibrio rotiferianus]
AAKRIVFGCYLGCHRPAKEEVPETLSPKLEGFDPQWFLDQWFSMDNERHAGISSQMKEIVYANPPRDMASTAILLGAQKMKYNPMPDVLESEEFKRGKETYDRTCKACHGEQGASTQKNFPPLKGQMPTYIYEQMIAYRDGKRTNGALAGIMM